MQSEADDGAGREVVRRHLQQLEPSDVEHALRCAPDAKRRVLGRLLGGKLDLRRVPNAAALVCSRLHSLDESKWPEVVDALVSCVMASYSAALGPSFKDPTLDELRTATRVIQEEHPPRLVLVALAHVAGGHFAAASHAGAILQEGLPARSPILVEDSGPQAVVGLNESLDEARQATQRILLALEVEAPPTNDDLEALVRWRDGFRRFVDSLPQERRSDMSDLIAIRSFLSELEAQAARVAELDDLRHKLRTLAGLEADDPFDGAADAARTLASVLVEEWPPGDSELVEAVALGQVAEAAASERPLDNAQAYSLTTELPEPTRPLVLAIALGAVRLNPTSGDVVGAEDSVAVPAPIPDSNPRTESTGPPQVEDMPEAVAAEGPEDQGMLTRPAAFTSESESSDQIGEKEPSPVSEDDRDSGTLRSPTMPSLPALQDTGAKELLDAIPDLLDGERLGLAYWAAKVAGDHELASALEFVAVSTAIRVATGNCAARFHELALAVDVDAIVQRSQALLLVTVAAARAAVHAPFSRVDGLLEGLAVAHTGYPQLADVLTAIDHAARSGVLLGPEVAEHLGMKHACELRLAAVVEAANEARQAWPTRNVKFHLATRIWQAWIAESGPLGTMLSAVASADSSALASVAEAALNLRSGNSMEKLIDETARGLGRKRTEPVIGGAREKLREWAEECLDLISEWVEAASELAALQAALTSSSEHRQIEELRSAVVASWSGVEEALSNFLNTENPLDAACTRLALKVAGELGDEIIAGTAHVPARRTPTEALHRDLLRTPRVLIDSNGEPDTDSVSPEAILEAVNCIDWIEAFEARLLAADYLACDLIVAVIAESDLPLAQAMERQADERFPFDLQSLREEHGQVEALVAKNLGEAVLSDSAATEVEALVEDARPVGGRDLRSMRERLEAARTQINTARVEALDVRDKKLQELRTTQRISDEAAARLRHVIDSGDLLVADEFLSNLQVGLPLPVDRDEHREFDRFFPAICAEVAERGLDAVIEAARSRSDLGQLMFAQLDAHAGSEGIALLEAWRELGAGPLPDRGIDRLLLPVLDGIALPFSGTSARVTSNPSSAGHLWLEVSGARPRGDAIVGEFGSKSLGQYRVLLLWKRDTGIESLLDLIAEDSSSQPIVVLMFGVLKADARRNLVESLRRKQRRPDFIVIDDAAVAYMASLPLENFQTTMRLALPFTLVQPYAPFAAGRVPVEMFYGRRAMVEELADRYGKAFVYGGRQLGKSALLRATERRVNADPSGTAIYVDLNYEDIGIARRTDDIWDVLLARLDGAGIPRPSLTSRRDRFEFVRTQLLEHLAGGPDRRVVILLDECDALLRQDSEQGFQTTHRIRGLMDETDRRVKFVLSGLHVVQRFDHFPNQPLAHVAASGLVVGPLPPQEAHDLVQRPFEALGYEFEGELVHRLLAFSNFQASIIQLVCRALLERLAARARPAGWVRVPVTAAIVEETLADHDLRVEVRRRFEWTIGLDDHYRVAAYRLALHAHERGASEPLAESVLLDLCTEVWDEGFSAMSPSQFRELIVEMVGLGILRRVEGGVVLRSPNLLRLLGTPDELMEALLREGGFTATPLLDRSKVRRRHEGAAPSPLHEVQIDTLLGGVADLVAVVGSRATGLERVNAELLARVQAAPEETHEPVEAVLRRRDLHEALEGSPTSALVVAEAAGLAPAVLRQQLWGETGPRHLGRRVRLAIGPSQAVILADVPHRVALERFDAVTVQTLMADDSQLNDEEISDALEVTGGWPMLIEAWLSERRRTPKGALQRLRDRLATPEAAADLVEAAGLKSSPALATVWRAFSTWESLSADDLASVIDDPAALSGLDSAEIAMLFQLADLRGDLLVPEPALLAASRLASS